MMQNDKCDDNNHEIVILKACTVEIRGMPCRPLDIYRRISEPDTNRVVKRIS